MTTIDSGGRPSWRCDGCGLLVARVGAPGWRRVRKGNTEFHFCMACSSVNDGLFPGVMENWTEAGNTDKDP